MASAAVAVQDKRRVISTGWMISQKDDLIWFIGSVVASYALLFANLKLGVSLAILVWIWALGFDGPHVYGTLSRTYADRDERRKRAKLYYGSLLWFALGPAMVFLGRMNFLGTGLWIAGFFLFASLWAYYHLVKQHYGFMILYKKKNHDLAELDNLIDRAFLFLGMTYPLLHFMQYGLAAKGRVPFNTLSGPFAWFTNLVLFGFLISLVLFLGRQAQRVYLKQPVNVPKLLLLAAALPVHWIVARLLEPVEQGDLALVATLTIYHNIQYHRIIWFHNQNKYKPGSSFGLASVINKNVWMYIGIALLFGAAYHIPHYTIVPPGGYAAAFIWGGAFLHYYLDSKIWRVRSDRQLNDNLHMAEEKPATA
jgi:hypothetical protein